MKLLIIQTSPLHTASTLLVNGLYGLIPECFDKKIKGTWDTNFESDFENVIILKSHELNIDKLKKRYKKYKLIFVCSQRLTHKLSIDAKYKAYNNVLVFNYVELNETKTNHLEKIVDTLYTRLKQILPNEIELSKEKCMERITNMNKRYEEIKDKDFNYVDSFYQIHGSHRNRIK
jgi:hypothetical protein